MRLRGNTYTRTVGKQLSSSNYHSADISIAAVAANAKHTRLSGVFYD